MMLHLSLVPDCHLRATMNATTSTTHDSDSDDELYEIGGSGAFFSNYGLMATTETIMHARVKADNSGWVSIVAADN